MLRKIVVAAALTTALVAPAFAATTYYVLVDSAGQFSEMGGGYDFQIYKVGVEAACNDGLDNDGDTLVDCQDPDCFGPPDCGTETTCNEGSFSPGWGPEKIGSSPVA